MVKVILNPGLRALSGTMGDWTYRRMYGKQTLMKTPDMSKVKWSKAQEEHRKRFRKAVFYAKRAMADPTARTHYEKIAKKTGRQPFRLAISDYFKGKDLLKAA
jgi:hypothetical protein